MSISSSLSAGVSGLNANSQRLATISDNIANSATDGYKRSVSDFHSMVVQSGAASKYTAGGVRTTTTTLIDDRGQLRGTNNPTDIAINGRGFLPVANLSSLSEGGRTDLGLATTGSFRPNDEGILVDPAGKVLMGWPLGVDGELGAVPRDSGAGLEPVNVYHNQVASSPTDSMTIGLNLPAADSGTAGADHDISLGYFGTKGETETLSFGFESTDAPDTWNLTVNDSAGSDPSGPFTLTFADDGTLASVDGGDWDPETGIVTVNSGAGDIEVNIGARGDLGGITQMATEFTPGNLSKNGAPVGSLVSVEVDEKGVVNGIYDSGFTRKIFQIPVIDVPNPNGLSVEEAGFYRTGIDSGPMFLWDAGSGPVGSTQGFSLEGSSTDVAQELTDLIQTQRAYSSNAKVIQTVDEMLQETTNLKR